MLLSVHIPKCGGTSFRLLLEKTFGERLYFDYSRRWTRRDAGELSEMLKGRSCFHGHMDPAVLDREYEFVTKITWIRHPVPRIVSYFNHIRRHGDMGNELFRQVLADQLTLAQFGALPWIRNGLLTYLNHDPSQFAFIGIIEKSRTSLAKLRKTGLLENLESCFEFPHVNVADPLELSRTPSLDGATLETLFELNREDIDFYEDQLHSLECS